MSLVDRFSRTFNASPLMLRMIVVPEGVKVGLYRKERVASYADVMATPGLPEPLIRFLQATGRPQEHIYQLAWPDAKALYDALKATPSDKLILEADEIATLTRIERPAKFRLHWAYNAAQKRLERQLINADLHLGKGWFSEGKSIWLLHRNLPESMSAWLSKLYIPAADLYRFVAEFMPAAANFRLPVTCDLHIERNVSLRLEMIRLLSRSIDVQLTSNEPGLLEGLEYLDGDAENMISGTSLFPGLRRVINAKLLQIAHATTLTHIAGNDLPAFIQDDLRERAAALGVDMHQIDERYPIVAADHLQLSWRTTHEVVEAVGRYVATPYLADILLQTLASKANAGERFMLANKGWIEFTPAFLKQLGEWKAQGIERFQISPQEILGLRSMQVQLSGLQLPEIVLPEESLTLEHIARFIEILRRQGLPGGFSGLQNEASALLIGACQRLLRDNPKAKILWIVAQRRRTLLAEALQRLQVAHENSEAPQSTPQSTLRAKPEGRVTLASPGTQVELAKSWTLIIFEELDLLAFSDAQVYFYYQLERQWSLATFSRTNWADDRRRAQQAMHALQLAPENLSTFRDKYVRAFPEESRTLLAKLASPLKKAITGNPVAAPIMPPQSHEPPTVRGDTPVHNFAPLETPIRGMPPLPSWAMPSKETFLVQAQRYANHAEPPTEPVPFNQSWPTYSLMTSQQKAWYFYWRSQARLGNWLPADTGYLFLNAYEVVNLIGFRMAQNAFTYFANLWRHYRVTVPKLDRYFVDWLADFTVVYPVSITALDWYDQARRAGANCSNFDLCIEAWLHAGASMDTLPVDNLYQMAGYSPVKNKFYQEHNQQQALDSANKKGVGAIDQFLRQTDGKSLFEIFRPALPRPIQRQAFAGALYEKGHAPITVALASPWLMTESSALSRRLTSIIKYTENILRRQAKFKSQLQGIDLPYEWIGVLEKTFAVTIPATIAAPRRSLTIDMASVDTLKRESDEILKRLIVEAEAEQVQQTPPILPPVPTLASPIPVSTATNDNLTELVAVSTIIGDAQGTRARLLRVLRDHQWQVNQPTLNSAMLPGQFLNVELDYINESAFENLGDSLIFENHGAYTVAEDYRDEIEYILDHAATNPAVVTSPPVAVESAAPQNDYSDLNDDWARFVQRLKPYHWEILAVLLDKTDNDKADVALRLNAIARSVSTTTSRLVDDINAFALDSIGDIVIATDREPPYIEDEDLEDLQALLAWAQSKALLEN